MRFDEVLPGDDGDALLVRRMAGGDLVGVGPHGLGVRGIPLGPRDRDLGRGRVWSEVPVHRATQVPMPMSSTSQHITPLAQSSRPAATLSAMQLSPGWPEPIAGTQAAVSHALPPSLMIAEHFSPSGQS